MLVVLYKGFEIRSPGINTFGDDEKERRMEEGQ
jgi:hypothetical protein